MLGRVKWDNGESTLSDTGEWECSNEESLSKILVVSNKEDYSPAHGAFGIKMLQDAAKVMNGRVKDQYTPSPLPEGAIP